MSYADYITRIRQLVDDSCDIPLVTGSYSAKAGGFAAGTYKIGVSAVTEFGETLARELSIAIPGIIDDWQLDLIITRVPSARAYRIYQGDTLKYLTQIPQFQTETYAHSISTVGSGVVSPTSDTGTIHARYPSFTSSLDGAVAEYSTLKPLHLTERLPLSTGVSYCALPAYWVDGFSFIDSLRYPDSNTRLDKGIDFEVRNDLLYFLNLSPKDGQYAEIYYTTVHILDESQMTIPDRHFEGVCLLAASKVCAIIATNYSHRSKRVIGSDSVAYNMKSTDFRSMIDEYRKSAMSLLGTVGAVIPASADAEWFGRGYV